MLKKIKTIITSNYFLKLFLFYFAILFSGSIICLVIAKLTGFEESEFKQLLKVALASLLVCYPLSFLLFYFVSDRRTPLHIAASKGNYEKVESLISKGWDVSSLCGYGWAPIHEAAEADRAKIVMLLVSKGANVNLTDKRGSTALHYAAYSGNFNTVKVLLDIGADKNLTNVNGETAYDIAKKYNRESIIGFLK